VSRETTDETTEAAIGETVDVLLGRKQCEHRLGVEV
jgi:hypothetical protein